MPTPLQANKVNGFAHQRALIAALLIETVLFTVLSPAFFSSANLFEILRFSVELGLLAVALTPVLITGGIDLSVGSTVGLVSVVFGIVSREYHLSIGLSIVVALLVAVICGV